MTNQPPPRDPDTQPIRRVGTGERKRAAVALGVLAVAALALVVVMIYVFGSTGKNGTTGPTLTAPTGPPVTVTGGGSSPPPRTSSSHPHPKHTKSPTSPSSSTSSFSGPVSCPTSAPCSLPDDVGNVIQALNDYRTAHGAKAVSGSVTQAARDCALGNGEISNCPSGYYWEPVGRSGAQVIAKIAAANGGTSFLLDHSMTAVEVGWAYLPSSHGYECAVVAKH
jgi:hypothetical protein